MTKSPNIIISRKSVERFENVQAASLAFGGAVAVGLCYLWSVLGWYMWTIAVGYAINGAYHLWKALR